MASSSSFLVTASSSQSATTLDPPPRPRLPKHEVSSESILFPLPVLLFVLPPFCPSSAEGQSTDFHARLTLAAGLVSFYLRVRTEDWGQPCLFLDL